MAERYPHTPDGRYFVVRGRLWRCTNPALPEHERKRLIADLMDARRSVGAALKRRDADALAKARNSVNEAKVAFGERGPVWWTDGAPDFNRRMVRTTTYADWFDSLEKSDVSRLHPSRSGPRTPLQVEGLKRDL